MLKKICKIGCLVLILAMMSVPAWSFNGANMGTDDLVILVRGGHGPGDGTGNSRSGPGDGMGNGSRSGDCPNLKTDVNDDLLIAGRGNGRCSRGNGGGKGSGGNGGRGSGRNGGVSWRNS